MLIGDLRGGGVAECGKLCLRTCPTAADMRKTLPIAVNWRQIRPTGDHAAKTGLSVLVSATRRCHVNKKLVPGRCPIFAASGVDG
jgi:hypothetical protein